jgi:hypothetical protein
MARDSNTQRARSIVIVLSRRKSVSLRLLFIYAARSGLATDMAPCRLVSRTLGVTATSVGPSRVSSHVPRTSIFRRRLVLSKVYAESLGRQRLPSIIFRRGSPTSSGMPFAPHVRSKALYTRRAARRALLILAFWPGTARGTVSSYDDGQCGAAKAS